MCCLVIGLLANQFPIDWPKEMAMVVTEFFFVRWCCQGSPEMYSAIWCSIISTFSVYGTIFPHAWRLSSRIERSVSSPDVFGRLLEWHYNITFVFCLMVCSVACWVSNPTIAGSGLMGGFRVTTLD